MAGTKECKQTTDKKTLYMSARWNKADCNILTSKADDTFIDSIAHRNEEWKKLRSLLPLPLSPSSFV